VGLRDGLLELGYRESEQFVLGVRFTQGNTALLPATAHELVQYGVDILIADADESTQALRLATTQIPIVFVAVSDPVRLGLVQSFARPGGNITGVADLGGDLGPKRLQVFREIVPALQRVLYPYAANDADAHAAGEIYRHTARRLGIELIEKAVQTEEEARALLAQVWKEDVDGILAPPSLSLNIPGAILEASTHRTIPTMFSAHGTFFVEEGGLASFGADAYAAGREAARLVDKILKGGAPAEIPVEVTTQIELTINLKTAKALELIIPPEVLYRADRLVR